MNMLDTEFDEYSSYRVEDLVRKNMFESLLKRLPKYNETTFAFISESVQEAILIPLIAPIEEMVSTSIEQEKPL